MRVTPENKIKKLVKDVLSGHPDTFWYPAVAGPYSVGGIPDIVGCSRGRFFGIEVKAPGKKPTALQLKRKAEIESASGKWFLVDGEDGLNTLRRWIVCPKEKKD